MLFSGDIWHLGRFCSKKPARIPSGSTPPHARPFTSAEREKLAVLDKRIEGETRFGEDEDASYAALVASWKATADEEKERKDFRSERHALGMLERVLDRRRVAQSGHLNRLEELKLERDSLLNGREP